MAMFDYIVRSPGHVRRGVIIATGELEHGDVFGGPNNPETELDTFFENLPEVAAVPQGQQIAARVYTKDDPPVESYSHVWDKA